MIKNKKAKVAAKVAKKSKVKEMVMTYQEACAMNDELRNRLDSQKKEKVSIKVVPDSLTLLPDVVINNNYLMLHSNVNISFAYRTTVKIDCGVSLTVPDGWSMKAVASDEFSSKGLLVSSQPIPNGRVILTVTNIGKEIINIKPLDSFAVLSVEKVYKLELE